MPSDEITQYYDLSEKRQIREDLVFAVTQVNGLRVAVDCGCGAGADLGFLLESGFKVYGFDVEAEAISRCKRRFAQANNLVLEQASFASYAYPSASLLVADASLFFCAENTMAGPSYDKRAFWPDVSVFDEARVKNLFQGFEILRFNEHRSSGESAPGKPHDWHIYSVVAKKL